MTRKAEPKRCSSMFGSHGPRESVDVEKSAAKRWNAIGYDIGAGLMR